MPLLRDYIAEHGQALEHADRMLRAIDRGDHASAQQDLDAFTGILAAHWKGEEDGLFAVLQLDSAYAAHITPLVAEHRELAALLADADVAYPDDQAALRKAVAELMPHIQKEEDGLFPASLTALSGNEWDFAIAAWQAAHPGESMRVS